MLRAALSSHVFISFKKSEAGSSKYFSDVISLFYFVLSVGLLETLKMVKQMQ